MLHFKPLNFKFRYNDGHEYCFIGTYGSCTDKYRAQKDDIAEVFQMVNSRYVKISD